MSGHAFLYNSDYKTISVKNILNLQQNEFVSLLQLKNLGTDLCIDTESKAENTRFGVTTCQLSNDFQVG